MAAQDSRESTPTDKQHVKYARYQMQEFNGLCMAVICILTVVNISVLGLVIKLYTEYFKDRSQVSRQQKNIETGKPSHNS